MKNNKGIEYSTTGNQERVDMCAYHRKPSVLNHSHGAKFTDVKNISTRVLRMYEGRGYRSFFTVGFEIEKSRFGRGARQEYALIQGYERDGSCGVEAVTNILPLIPPSQWRNKVFDMIFKARKIMDDENSPSNFRCGGHITIGVNGLIGDDVRKKIRLNSAIFMSLFRKRLKNHYCKHNLRMESKHENTHFNRWHYKYQFALVKDNCFEFRIPSRITSYKQMFRRYELMYHIVDFSVFKPNAQFSTLLRKVKPIILSMYEGDVEKTDNILFLAKDFRKFIKDGKISDNIRDFIV